MISVQDLGGPTAVARMVGLSVPTVHGWKAIPFAHCPVIEKALSGRVRCEQMRPDKKWVRVPDADWPQGRPLMDFIDDANPAQAKGVANV